MSYFRSLYMGAVLAAESAVEKLPDILNSIRVRIQTIPPSLESKVELSYQPKVNQNISYQHRAHSNYLPWAGFYPKGSPIEKRSTKRYQGDKTLMALRISE